MNIEVFTMGLTSKIKLHLVIEIQQKNNSIILNNDKLNIGAVYENTTLSEAKEIFGNFLVESIIEYKNKGILDKIFKSANIELKTGIDNINKTINNEINRLLKKENGGLITKKENIFNFNEIEDNFFILSEMYKNSSWELSTK